MTAASPASAAFVAADFRDSGGSPDVWAESPFHVDALHGDLCDRVAAEFFARTRAEDSHPSGVVVCGAAGSGKTHCLGELRRRVWEGGGWFVRVDAARSEFWEAVAAGCAHAATRRLGDGRTQAGAALVALLARLGGEPAARAAAAQESRAAKRGAVDLLLAMLAAVEPAQTLQWRDVVRALALCDSRNAEICSFARQWLQGAVVEENRCRALGFATAPPPPAQIVQGLNWLLALAGPTLIAIDGVEAPAGASAAGESGLTALAGGLAALHEATRRAQILVACREESWSLLRERAPLDAVFRPPRLLSGIGDAALAERLIATRLAPAYAQVGFAPPYPAFPFTRAALASGVGLTPRELLDCCVSHQEICATEGGIRECQSLAMTASRGRSTRELPERRDLHLGRSVQVGEVGPVTLPAKLLSRHVAIFAEAGRGAFLSRFVEEAALAGTPAVVVDADGDLARLGEPWPSRPTEFSEEDARKAKAHGAFVETALWTPGLPEGRPLRLAALPDFAALARGGDPDAQEAREIAVDMAVAALEPYLPARGAKAIRLRGLLADAFRVFARQGGGGLDEFVRLLGGLPEAASRLPEARQLGREVAEALLAGMRANPMLSAGSEPSNAARLLAGSAGKTRVSVVTLAGLDDASRRLVVHQLLMMLFVWIRTHPCPAGLLLAIDEAHHFAPARETTPFKRSVLALIRAAAGRGLSLVFATSAARSLDPAIAAGCLTQIYGLSSSAADTEVVAASMAARGGTEDRLALLKPGEFFFSSEEIARPIRLRAPPSLSRRTLNRPRREEIVARARRGARDD